MKKYFVTTSTGVRISDVDNEYTAVAYAEDLHRKAGELSVSFSVAAHKLEDGEATVIMTWSR
jgi:hypothetical protein